eukprot:scaffold56168_cov73-Phaeocystis_antarctica.AAC.2
MRVRVRVEGLGSRARHRLQARYGVAWCGVTAPAAAAQAPPAPPPRARAPRGSSSATAARRRSQVPPPRCARTRDSPPERAAPPRRRRPLGCELPRQPWPQLLARGVCARHRAPPRRATRGAPWRAGRRESGAADSSRHRPRASACSWTPPSAARVPTALATGVAESAAGRGSPTAHATRRRNPHRGSEAPPLHVAAKVGVGPHRAREAGVRRRRVAKVDELPRATEDGPGSPWRGHTRLAAATAAAAAAAAVAAAAAQVSG